MDCSVRSNPNPNPNPSPSPNPKPKPNLVHDGLQRAVGAHEVAWVGAQVGIARGADLALAEVAHDARAAEGVQALNDGACQGGSQGVSQGVSQGLCSAVGSAALQAARSSTLGSGWASGGPASFWRCGVAQSGQARPEEAREPSGGPAKAPRQGGTL